MNFKITTGILKNLPLTLNPNPSTRPTKSIVRQSCFNTIGSEIIESVFIEGFGGCGSMGIEALSRGASRAIFFEKDAFAYEILLENLALANKRESSLVFQAYNADFFTAFWNLQKAILSAHNVILYLDPPFCIRKGMEDIYEQCFTFIQSLEQGFVNLIVFEHWSEYNIPHFIGDFALYKTRKFGKTTLTYYLLKDA
ncbi:16S rRNA (guanine(966)-N(2))-methyltransferase RsmD [Helicobacter sp. MIT 05-5293]|uniref:16S rRNA (guanine(966)-N(2))-methyltransferase RsmD n=1 Tax=Helicobacter sp. MIT 05-5293 TaxID=1548149 RepID=UPI00051CEE0D|nr:16S rRNA (guanine(966)-N(2))-methyltransferase RsmD [Helicobacter sp. MIT 05-5293]TLD81715.1 16S rRNA (guanine(966)-N(2))-methyltransferase RsmD [Helicobacter sp. MIT 05-5293]